LQKRDRVERKGETTGNSSCPRKQTCQAKLESAYVVHLVTSSPQSTPLDLLRQATQNGGMSKLYSAAQAAARLKTSKATVNRWSATLGLGQVVGTSRVLSDADLATLKPKIRKKSGNPNMVAGNDLWRLRKKSNGKPKAKADNLLRRAN